MNTVLPWFIRPSIATSTLNIHAHTKETRGLCRHNGGKSMSRCYICDYSPSLAPTTNVVLITTKDGKRICSACQEEVHAVNNEWEIHNEEYTYGAEPTQEVRVTLSKQGQGV